MIDLKQGDCLELMNNIPNKSIDLILCDLPYGTTDCKWDSIIPFDKLWKQYNRIIKDNGAILLFSQMPFGANLIMSNTKMFRYEWIWEKPNTSAGFLNAKKMPLRKHENILVLILWNIYLSPFESVIKSVVLMIPFVNAFTSLNGSAIGN